MLGVLFGSRVIRAPFEFTPLRYVGLWSYSLYLWHGPALAMYIPGTQGFSVLERLMIGLVLSYASYQFIERPVMLYRKRTTTAAPVNSSEVTLEGSATSAVVGAS